jgi:hypothetical protein
MYNAYITKVKNIRPAENADKLNLCEVFGNTTVVDKSVNENDLYLYLPTDGRISVEFGEANNLFRKKDDAGNNIGGFIDAEKRNISAIRLRGNKSDGLVLPLSSLSSFGDITSLKEGDIVTVFNGHVIAEKYIPRQSNRSSGNFGRNKTRKKKIKINLPYFAEHIDTPQLAYNMDMFKPGDLICLTEKIHGTSSRNANTLQISYKRNLFHKLFNLKGKKVEEYKYIAGTRRTVLENATGGYYGTNEFRFEWANKFKDKLMPGECVFGEIAGFIAPGQPIMAKGDNKKTKDKNFIKTFGDTTVFSYGCSEEEGNSRYFIYRMTYTTPEGFVFEYPWDFVKLRAEQMGFEVVPELDRFIYTTEEDFLKRIEEWMDIPSTIDSSHIIEGVVVRALNAPNSFRVAKNKSFNFRVIEGIIKDTSSAPDMEEAQEVTGEV